MKPYQCVLCETSFAQSENLYQHMRYEIGEKPFSCSVCSKTFTHSHYSKMHLKTHKKISTYNISRLLKVIRAKRLKTKKANGVVMKNTTSSKEFASALIGQREGRAPPTANLLPQSPTATSFAANTGESAITSSDYQQTAVEPNPGSYSNTHHESDSGNLASTKSSVGKSIYVEETAFRKSTSSVPSTSRIPDSYFSSSYLQPRKYFDTTSKRKRESQENGGSSAGVGTSSSGK